MRFFKRLTALFVFLCLATGAQAAWPEKPVHLVVPYPPGGNVDLAARIVADGLEKEFGQPFVVENRPGAGGMIAASHVIKSDKDGYTLFVAPNGPVLFSPLLFRKDNYFWKDDFAPIGSISFVTLVLQVNPELDLNSAEALFDYAKEHPGELAMASPGAGTQNHLISEMMQRLLHTEWLTVHYKGNAPATTDLLGGRVDFNFDQYTVAKQYINSGKLNALAVTSPERMESLPDVPTLKELGYSDAVSETFTGLFGPAGMPEDVVNELNAALEKILNDPAVVKKFETAGAEARAMDVDDFKTFLTEQYDRWGTLIRGANIHR
ncbi:Bug family tripartite tricarboxylate transporter substrate binding protein [Alloalcanivorax profundimaris]|uniref:Bug family tripartite tricarboxylate transporter substrate binding protein n=1 Tax=Alloalcanivorax profundimaris TaxID=2735259 RepID=UPI001886EF1A|nr:tripartite tricarboxylate transporter substrate binding protein [Alloalcanivorax profundimaris]MBF1803542.1 tripartite tricarboxylate transporter substrate binding protein [Alloalcanivorax profundimaris]MCQ6261532.1 tripartite tricarboxylate transporter substrate binding protein [Alcanivorax sp. MM125-6]